MKRSISLLFLFTTTVLFSFGQKNIMVRSPDGNILCNFSNNKGKVYYQVLYKKHLLIDNSPIILRFPDAIFENNLVIGIPENRQGDEVYELVVGKARFVRDHYREVSFPVTQSGPGGKLIKIRVRVFDDGLAFRYEFPKQKNWNSFVLSDEETSFRMTGDPIVRGLFLPNYTTSHEGKYSTLPLSAMKEDTLMDMPALFEFPNHIYLAITEAKLIDYAGMYLSRHRNVLRSRLSPLPNQNEIKVKAYLPHTSPWRVLLISDRVGSLIESNIITDLNDSCKIKDISWIKPGKTTFPWWNGNVVPDTLNAPGINFVTQQYYIDFCARNALEYHSVVEYGLRQWYVDDGVNFQPGLHSDVTTPVPGLNMKEVCDYAKSKGVGVRVWVHWAALYPKLDTAFALFEQWGIKGMMVDFMDRDDQEMVNIQNEILQKAAAHHLHIQFHGAYKNTGLSRTFPNEFTREGTLNYETNKWSKDADADHDIYMPFTRMLAGSTDYHLGGFRAVPDSLYVIQFTRPLMMSTRCHMLAMYAVLENYLGMVCDYPSAYEGQPGFEFLKEIPTVWDETKVVDAKVGQYVIIARRKNKDWWVGMITNREARQVSVPMRFLPEGNYQAVIYTDARDVGQFPNHLNKETRSLTKKDSLNIYVAGSGGFVMHIKGL
ncbi:MAG: glycoside hydrolase [Bacteroidetes bacterium]|nr:MAG: glycoside hydrolase [Bacteroidota bacterium]